MLALDKSIQKARIPTYTQFNKVKYLQSQAISALLTEKFNVEELISNHSNIRIRVAKSIEERVIRTEILERWQQLNVNRILLVPYLGEKIIEIPC